MGSFANHDPSNLHCSLRFLPILFAAGLVVCLTNICVTEFFHVRPPSRSSDAAYFSSDQSDYLDNQQRGRQEQQVNNSTGKESLKNPRGNYDGNPGYTKGQNIYTDEDGKKAEKEEKAVVDTQKGIKGKFEFNSEPLQPDSHSDIETQLMPEENNITTPDGNTWTSAVSSIPHQCVLIKPAGAKVIQRRHDNFFIDYNARMFCLVSNLCIGRRSENSSGAVYEALNIQTACRRGKPDLISEDTSVENIKIPCSFIKHSVYCSFNLQSETNLPCKEVLPLSSVPGNRTMQIPHMTIVVPAYFHLNNIFHFVHVIGHISQLIAALNLLYQRRVSGQDMKNRLRRVTLLFRGDMPSGYGDWQGNLTSSMIENRYKALGFEVDVKSLYEDEYRDWFVHSKSESFLAYRQRMKTQTVCLKNAVMLGQREPPAWPFATHKWFDEYLVTNHTPVSSVPAEALTFKASVYQALSLPTVLNTPQLISSDVVSFPPTLLLDFPPLSIGYARRNTDSRRDPSPGNYILGRARRFSDGDEAWFTDMLKSVARQYEMNYTVLEPSTHEPFGVQVSAFKSSGVIVGIHGANLVNCIFMHSFAALVELGNEDSVCYYRGENSGLNYWQFIPSHIATAEESFCGPDSGKCLASKRNRRIFMEIEEDRVRSRVLVEEAARQILEIRRTFRDLGGIPVKYNRETSEYDITWPTENNDKRG